MLLLYELFTVVESVAFIGFLFLQIKNREVKKAALMIGGAFILFSFLYPYFYKDEKLIDSVPIGVETIIIMVFSFYFLYERTNDTTTLYIYSIPPFWIVIGMVLYLAGSFFIYLFASSLNKEEVLKYWSLTNFFGFIKNVLFMIGIIVNSKPPKTLPHSDFEFSSLN